MNLSERLRAWAQNEEMIDASYTAHGHDCNEAARLIAEDTALNAAHDRLSDALENDDAGNDEVRDAAIDVCDALNAHYDKRRKAREGAPSAPRGGFGHTRGVV